MSGLLSRTALALATAAVLPALSSCGSGAGHDPTEGGSPRPEESASDAGSGRLLMSSFDEATHTFLETFVVAADGSGRTTVPMPGPEGGGRWSHQGTEIAVMTEREDGRIGTAVIAPDGRVLRVLDIADPTLNLVCTVWSPDDSRLACEGWDDGAPARSGIYTVSSADGSALERVTTPGPDASDLPGDFSPDGAVLVFRRGVDEDDGTLMTVDVDGGEPRRLGTVSAEDPGRFSPTGEAVLTSVGGRLLLLDPAAGEVVGEVAEPGAYLFGPVWSPSGDRIAFSRATGGPHADVWTALPDGTDRHQVTSTPDNEIRVEWAP